MKIWSQATRLCDSVLTATALVNSKRQIVTPYVIETFQPTAKTKKGIHKSLAVVPVYLK